MKNKVFLHFSLGPVQSFVAQARRTRDFWAGSFILSWLAGQAMLVVHEAGGELILPAVVEEHGKITDPLLAAIKQREKGEIVSQGPEIATLPNRFQARIPDDFDPLACVEAIQRKWRDLAEKIWQDYIQPVAHLGKGTREIWDRQITGFWEMNWVIGNDSALLDRRKNWRSHVPPIEHGDKCTLMGNFQELSGYLRIRGEKQQEYFWASLRAKTGEYELANNERLCAIALVKRLLPLVAVETLWLVPRRYPSTPYLAAIPWIAEVCIDKPEKARKYATEASQLPGANRREEPERFFCLQKALTSNQEGREFTSLDGNCFHKAALHNDHLWEQGTGRTKDTAGIRRQLIKLLDDLGKPVTPFYAMLLMDGDRLGALLQNHSSRVNLITNALASFNQSVKEVINKYNGITVFAGGDDVLAMLPLDGALPAALTLRHLYTQSFTKVGLGAGLGTISGAIVYAHYTTPLTAVYQETHRLLDNVAKDKTGRDSLAIAVWKGVGRVLTWAAPWAVIGNVQNNVLDELIKGFKESDCESRELNSSFFYNLRQRFTIFEGGIGLELSPQNMQVMKDVLVAEYLKNRERHCSLEEARIRMEKLLNICRQSWRDEDGKIYKDEGILTFDGVLLVKFLAQKGVIG
jgi:CRISPR-associated protein Cmr2